VNTVKTHLRRGRIALAQALARRTAACGERSQMNRVCEEQQEAPPSGGGGRRACMSAPTAGVLEALNEIDAAAR
jgi:hypothetical protein